MTCLGIDCSQKVQIKLNILLSKSCGKYSSSFYSQKVQIELNRCYQKVVVYIRVSSMKSLKKFVACIHLNKPMNFNNNGNKSGTYWNYFIFMWRLDFFWDSMLLTHVSILGNICLKDWSHFLCRGWKIRTFVAYIMLRLMNCGQLLIICRKLSMALIVHAIAKFMFLLLILVIRLAMKCFLESLRYGKTLCARKMSLCSGINKIVYSVNMISVVLIYCHCVPRKPRDLMTMWSLGGDLLLDKLYQWVNHKRNWTLHIRLLLLMS
jgi:hypothetical protein